jgi:hypothetical protein
LEKGGEIGGIIGIFLTGRHEIMKTGRRQGEI